MMHFNSLGAFANHLAGPVLNSVRKNLEMSLEEIGKSVAEEARQEVGVYQSGIGQYPAWAPLAASTLEKKARYGWGRDGNPDTPLWATGAFHDDIGYTVDKSALAVSIGTSKAAIVYTELGTARMPPRPVFGPAALRVVPNHVPTLGWCVFQGIAGARIRSFPQRGQGLSNLVMP